MRKFLIIFLVLSTFSFQTLGKQNENLFDKANSFYEQGNYKIALKNYLHESGNTTNWKLFFNIGNCYFKLGDFLNSKIYYLKALRLKPFNSSIRKNIKIVNTKLGIKGEKYDYDFLSGIILRIDTFFSVNAVSIVFLAIIFIVNYLFIRLMLSGKNKVVVYGLIFSIIFLIFTGFYHWYRVKKETLHNKAVVISENSRLYSGPGEGNTVLYNIIPGVRIKIVEENGKWFYISRGEGINGWIKKSNVKVI